MSLRVDGVFTTVVCDTCGAEHPTTETFPTLAFYDATLHHGWVGGQIDTDYDRGYAAAMASARGLIEAGLLAAPSVVQGGPSLGADHLVAAHLRADERLQGIPIFVSDGTECLIPPADERHAAPQAPADPPAGVESGQDGSGAVRGVVEYRMRALAADMDRDTPLTAEILRQFADEVTQLRAAGDRAVQSIVSRLPDGTYPTTPDGK